MLKYIPVIFMSKQFKGSLALLGATVIWGSAFVFQSVGMDLIGPMTFQGIRCLLALFLLFPLSYFFDLSQGNASDFWKRWKSPALWKNGAFCGLALFFAANAQQIGLVYTDAGKAGFITAMYIVMVPILGIFVGKRPAKAAVISVMIAVVGLYLLSAAGVSSINIGDIYLVVCAICFGVQILLVDHFAGALDGIRLNFVQSAIVAALSLPCAFALEPIDWGNIWACRVPLAFTGFASMGIAYSLQIIGQKDLEPTRASLIMSLESVFAALGGWLVLHETMTTPELLGSVLVFSAVILSQLPSKK